MSISFELQQRVDKACENFITEIQKCLEVNEKLNEMDSDQRLFFIETEVLPILDDIINYDPTEQTPYEFFHQ